MGNTAAIMARRSILPFDKNASVVPDKKRNRGVGNLPDRDLQG